MQSTFDSIVDSKVGFGKYQHISIGIASLIHFTDGSDIMASSLILPILQREWNLSTSTQGVLGFIFFAGLFIGSLVSGFFSDKFGRRNTLLYVIATQAGTAIALSLAPELYTFMLLRGIFGFLVGLMIPFGPAIASESSPTEMRGKIVIVANTFFSVGFLFSTLMGAICFTSLKIGNWRLMIFLSSLPTYILFYMTKVYLKESPRFLIAKGKIDEGVEVLNQMAEINQLGLQSITSADKLDLDIWRKQVFDEKQETSVMALLIPSRRKVTLLLWTLWINVNFVAYGMVFILPFMLADLSPEVSNSSSGEKGIIDIMIPVFAQIPSCFVAYAMVEKEYLGRRKTIMLSSILGAAVYFLMFFTQVTLLTTFTSISRFLAQLSFNILFPFTAELYLTTLRVVGLGWGYGFGKFGASICPSIVLGLYSINMFLPLLSFAASSVIIAIAAFFIPKETRGKALDAPEEDIELTNDYILQK